MVEAAGREGAKGRFKGHKHFPAAAARAHFLEITHDGAAHFMVQRINLGAVLLGARERELLQRPVDVLKPQPGDLAAAQTIHDEQQQDRAIANGAWLFRVARRDDLLEIFPGGAGRERFVAEQARTFDRGSNAGTAPLLNFGIPKERSKRLRAGRDRNAAPVRSLASEKGIGIRHGYLCKNPLLCAEPGEKPFDVPLVIGNRCRR